MNTVKKNTKPLDDIQLRTFFHKVFEARAKAAGASARRVRTRLLLACLLSRYAGMRISEALQFRDENDIDAHGNVLVRGRWQRLIPLSPDACAQICMLCADPCLLQDRGRMCLMDQGYLRRSLEQAGKELDLRVNPTVLRRTRESELLRMGVSPELTQRFMGNALPNLTENERRRLHSIFRKWDQSRRIARHNSFRGVVQSISKNSFSCLLRMAAKNGMLIDVRCTLRALNALDLHKGSEATASFRSLQVEFLGLHDGGALPSGSNIFAAAVDEIWQGEGESKVLVRAAGGSIALILRENCRLEPGQQVLIRVAPEAVDIRPFP